MQIGGMHGGLRALPSSQEHACPKDLDFVMYRPSYAYRKTHGTFTRSISPLSLSVPILIVGILLRNIVYSRFFNIEFCRKNGF